MDYVYCTTTREKGSHFTYQERQTLEKMIIDNHKKPIKERISQSKMAEKLGVHRSTISRELKRGKITQRDVMWREYTSYSADVAQDLIDSNATAKGPPIKLGKSIDQRPKSANERSEFGHWKMDCVESGRGSRSCLLTLVERQTNYSLNFKLR